MIGEDETDAAALLPPRLPVLRARLRPGPEAGVLAGQPVLRLLRHRQPKGNSSPPCRRPARCWPAGCAFADHYPFDDGDMRDCWPRPRPLRAIPVTTRKDFVRIPPAFRSRVTVVTIRLEWEEPAAIEALLDPLAQRVPVPA